MIIRTVKILYSLLPILIIAAGCASSSQNDNKHQAYSNLVKLEKPGNTPHQPSKVYVDSVKQINIDNRVALLISGTFPDGCTKLQDVSHFVRNDSLHLALTSWRNPEMMCTQALSPFSYIYDKITKEELSNHSEIFIKSTAYKL